VRSRICTLVLLLSLVSAPMSRPAIASPIYRVTSEVAQGNSGSGLVVVLAPGQLVGINFAKVGERVASVAAGDRSQFVYTVSGMVINLRRIKLLNFEGEYNGNGSTTLLITTNGSSGQKVYPVTILFSQRRPAYRVVEISPDYDASPRANPEPIPLTTSQVPIRPSPPAEVAILPVETVPSVRDDANLALPPPVSETVKPDAVIPTLKVKKRAIVRKTRQNINPKTEVQPIAVAATPESTPLSANPRPQIDPQASYPKSQQRQSKKPLNNHQQANAIVLGLLKTKTYGVSRRRVQDAIYLLRNGRSLRDAAKKSGISEQTLQKLIMAGTRNA
jgi:hypothetical protein